MTVELLTTREAAEILRMSDRFVLDELRRKNLRGSKLGNEWRISPADLDAYVAAKANVRPVERRAS